MASGAHRTNHRPQGNAQRLVEELTLRGPQTRKHLIERLGLKTEDTLRNAIRHLNEVESNIGPDGTAPIYDAEADGAQLPEAVVKQIQGGRGPIPKVLMLGPKAGAAVGIEVGRSHLSAGVADANGRLLGVPAISDEDNMIDSVAPHTVFAKLAKLVKKQLKIAGVPPLDVRGVAVSIPGPVSLEGKTLAGSVMSAYEDIALPAKIKAALKKHAGVSAPVFVENDVDVLARGEQRYGKGYGRRDFMVVKCSGGIGAGIVSDERIVRGRSGGGAGEIGHCTIGPETLVTRGDTLRKIKGSPNCKCGGSGHLEAYAGGDGIVEHLFSLHPKKAEIDREAPLPDQLNEVMRLATEGRDPHREILLDAAALIGLSINTLIHLFNPECVLICGKLSEMGTPFLSAIQEECQDQRMLFGDAKSLIERGTGETIEERRLISVGGAATTALRKAPARFSYEAQR